ncbi:MAG: GNAT family N-acetyltransferase [Clostridia bacterium]|nr:GNAT family N-acetyltransferase [Clostridia bacterium]
MNIRPATPGDIPDIDRLLYQVAAVHAAGRPDLFVMGEKKYTDDELLAIIENDSDTRPIFVYEDGGRVWGYAFCILEDHADAHVLTPIRTLYIDDLCVDESCRGRHIGTALYDYVKSYARDIGCHNLTLNVWECNTSARKFYERMGMQVQKTGMEVIL